MPEDAAGKLLIGAHVSAAGGLDNAPERAASIGAGTAQIFSANQRQWTPKQPTESQIERWWTECAAVGLQKPIVHASYLINMSAVEEEKLSRSRNAFCQELHRSQALGVHGVVLHPGSHMGLGEQAGVRAVAESLDAVFEQCAGLDGEWVAASVASVDAPAGPVHVLLENTAGQGTNLGWRFQHLADIIRLMAAENRYRVGVCFDTCHACAAGNDLRNESGWRATWARVDDAFGIERIRAIHLNDSKQPLDSRRDRHAPLGQGEMGEAPFRRFATELRFRELPMVLETPSGMDGWAREIAMMRAWADREVPPEDGQPA